MEDDERWGGREGPPCKHCGGPTKWAQRLAHRDAICQTVECWWRHGPDPLRVEEPAKGQEGVEIIVHQGHGSLQLRRGTTRPGWPLEARLRRGLFAGAGGYLTDACQDRIIHVACPDGVLRWAPMSALEPFHG